jgi:iron complex transport system ATP-binding protein
MPFGLAEATIDFPTRGFVTVVGPNGAGKSTLLGILAGLRGSYRGECLYEGVELRRWKRRDFARHVSFVPQVLRLEFPFTAEQVVYMGRTPFAGGWYESPEDHAAVERAIAITDSAAFRHQDFRTLSGGERQRIVLASALAQTPETMLADEPTTFLDLRHQLAMYRLLRSLSAGMLVIAATHDLNLALTYSDRVVVLDRGRIAADGIPSEVLTPELIGRVFGVGTVIHREADGPAWIAYET